MVMCVTRIGLVFLLSMGLLSVALGGSLWDPSSAMANDAAAAKPVDEAARRRLDETLGKVQKMMADHIFRKLQLPPPFVPSRSCGEVIGIATKDEIQALSNVFIQSLFAGGDSAGLAGLATSTLLGQIKYDLQLVKVCMSCAEAAALLPADVVSAYSDDPFGFQNICADGSYGVDQAESAFIFVPVDPATGDIVAGSMQGLVYGRGATILLADAPSERVPANWTKYLEETDLEDVLASQADTLVSVIFGGAGAVAIFPDFLGYGESQAVDRTFLAKQFYARSYVLTWLAAREYVSSATEGCSELSPAVTAAGFSEGGYATIAGALGLRAIGVNILAAFPGAAPFQPSKQLTFSFSLFADGAPMLDPGVALFNLVVTSLAGYAFSNEFPFLANTGTGQLSLSDEYVTGDITTNALLWFKTPAQIGWGFLPFLPAADPISLVNPNVAAIYQEAALFDSENACVDFVSTATDKICQAYEEASLLPELETLVDFPTVVCHSPDDDIVGFINAPTFPFSNPFVTEYTGIPVLNILEPQGGHAISNLLCSISPILSLQRTGDDFPAKITPLAGDCKATDPPSVAPSKEPDSGPATNAPSESEPDSPTPTPSSAVSTVTSVACMFSAVFALIVSF